MLPFHQSLEKLELLLCVATSVETAYVSSMCVLARAVHALSHTFFVLKTVDSLKIFNREYFGMLNRQHQSSSPTSTDMRLVAQ
jgi:hypothetical protein